VGIIGDDYDWRPISDVGQKPVQRLEDDPWILVAGPAGYSSPYQGSQDGGRGRFDVVEQVGMCASEGLEQATGGGEGQLLF
jgi:hypothetical protein